MTSEHDRIAERLAKKFRTKHLREGVDLKTKDLAIEVAATDSDVYQSVGQLNRSRKPKKYIAVPTSLLPTAKRTLEGTGIGIMDDKGKIRKRTRKKAEKA